MKRRLVAVTLSLIMTMATVSEAGAAAFTSPDTAPAVATQTDAEEVNVTECFHRMHGWDADYWADTIWEGRNLKNRRDYSDEVARAGYDIKAVAREMQSFYLDKGR